MLGELFIDIALNSLNEMVLHCDTSTGFKCFGSIVTKSRNPKFTRTFFFKIAETQPIPISGFKLFVTNVLISIFDKIKNPVRQWGGWENHSPGDV